MSESGESNRFLNFAGGLLLGVGVCFLYVRFGIQMPAAIGVGQRITSEAIVKTAEFELLNESNSHLVRHRALAMILAQKPETFLEVDQAINNRFLGEYLRQHYDKRISNEPLVSNGLNKQPLTINPSKVGTSFVNSGTVLGTPPVGVAAKPDFVLDAMLRQKYPAATDEVINFLIKHPELRGPANQPDRQVILKSGLQIR